MLPLVGQKLALVEQGGRHQPDGGLHRRGAGRDGAGGDAGRRASADVWGRKPIFLAGFAVLALRGLLYPLSDDPYWLVGVQLLDGVGAGIFGALFPVIVADLTRAPAVQRQQGAIATAQGVGAALSARWPA